MIESTAKKISREYQENKNFAPKQNERDCPMTKFIHFCDLTVTKDDVKAFMAERPEYTKANKFNDINVKVYI